MQINVKVTGADKVLKALAEKGKDVKRAQTLGLERVAILLRDTIVDRYVGAGHPEHPEVQSGRLKGSIRHVVDAKGDKAYVGSDADHALWVEFGHAQEPGRFVPTLGKRLVASQVKPYPFMRPAVTEVFDGGKARRVMDNTLREVLKI